MAALIAVLGAGPHGHQLAALFPHATLYDDRLRGFDSCVHGAARNPWVVGAAWPKVRRLVAEKIDHTDDRLILSAFRRGVVVFPGAKVGHGVTFGSHVHVGFNAVISHGCDVGEFVTVCPGAVLSGEVTVEDDVFIGANATVIHGGITVGKGAIVGAGAVVVDNVPPGATVAGVPARRI